MGEDVRWKGDILGCPYLCIMWERMYAGGGNPGVSLPLHNVGEDVRWRGEILGCPYLCIMCGGGCTLEGGNSGVSLPLHNVWERMYAGRGKSWGVPTSA